MNAVSLLDESYDLDDTRFEPIEAPRSRLQRSTQSKLATRARYRRGAKGASSFNGSHRRREKRSYL